MAFVFKARTNPPFNRAGNRKGVAGFKKQTKLYPYKNRSKSPSHEISVLIVYPTQT